MKISEVWLREWVNPPLDTAALAAVLTMAGFEVDALLPVAGSFTGVIVAKVLETQPHPEADKLTICKVSAGAGELLQVVCGASNVRPNLLVALATIGAVLPNQLIIKSAKLRGQLSQGMLCSATELGLSDVSEGILELEDDAPLGMDIRHYFRLDDTVFDIDLTPNLAHGLSVYGIAREVALLTQNTLSLLHETTVTPAIADVRNIHLEADEGCSFYCGRVIRGLDVHAKTPLWLREKLRRSGIRSIHPVVDVTNYVMLELGQPMHAFNLNKIQGDLFVSKTRSEEKFLLLNDEEVILPLGTLVIRDEQKLLAVAGIMGGADSAVTDDVSDVFLESAYFDALHIAGVARKLGLFSDSAHRFERGVDPLLARKALERATDLLLSFAGGHAGPVVEETNQYAFSSRDVILFDPCSFKKRIGIDLAQDEMYKILEGLGMQVVPNGTVWEVTPPSYRFDLQLDVDLIEEIIRVYGYDRLPCDKMLAITRAGTMNPLEELALTTTRFLSSRGYNETINYSFVDKLFQEGLYPDADGINLINPLSPELSQLRVDLWPGLLAAMVYNINRQQNSLKLFESGVVFHKQGQNIIEKPMIAGLLVGEEGTLSWNEVTRKRDFFDAKGDLEALMRFLSIDSVTFKPIAHTALHPGQAAGLFIDDVQIGLCGVLHPRFASQLNVMDDVILFSLCLPELLNRSVFHYEPISKFPKIRRDLCLMVDEAIPAESILEAIRGTVKNNWLKRIDVFDQYEGDSIKHGKKSLTIALTLQNSDHTFIDDEINVLMSAIINKLEDLFAITLRS